jgi:phage terminase large subunit-like protein
MNDIVLNHKFRQIKSAKDRYIYLSGGRGSGKSFAVALFVAHLSYEPEHKILFTRYTITSASKSIIPEFVEKLRICEIEQDFHITKDAIINKASGTEILFSGIKTSSGNQTANLKSLQGITTWVYEEFEEHPNEESFDSIDLSIRKQGVQNRVILISNALHKGSWQYERFFKHGENTTHIYTTYEDNRENLNEQFLRMAEFTKETNLAKYNRNFLGEHYEDDDEALWTWDLIKRKSVEQYDRIVVAIDPAVTSNKDSDLTGIIVVGKRGNEGYVLDDKSGTYTPNEWANVALSLYHKWKADRVVGEVNNGGDMIEAIIRQADNSVSYKAVRATRGKAVRAEPIVSLYEQGLIYHTTNFPELELQMTTWNPTHKESPDRIDAMVWGFTELMLKNNTGWVI